jgi:hypothetical protein
MTHPEHIDQLPPDLFPTLAVCWATMDDLQTEDALDELQDWVAWVVDRYSLDHRVIPGCWDNHAALIEELSALRTAWIAAFCVTARPEAPLDWHQSFQFARQRLSDWASRTGCRPGEHRPDR